MKFKKTMPLTRVTNVICLTLAVSLFCTFLVSMATALEVKKLPSREEIDEKYKWKLEDIYSSDKEWEKAKNDLVPQFEQITNYKDKLDDSPESLLNCLELDTKFSKELTRLIHMLP